MSDPLIIAGYPKNPSTTLRSFEGEPMLGKCKTFLMTVACFAYSESVMALIIVSSRVSVPGSKYESAPLIVP